MIAMNRPLQSPGIDFKCCMQCPPDDLTSYCPLAVSPTITFIIKLCEALPHSSLTLASGYIPLPICC